jgi:hypothetical protein
MQYVKYRYLPKKLYLAVQIRPELKLLPVIYKFLLGRKNFEFWVRYYFFRPIQVLININV